MRRTACGLALWLLGTCGLHAAAALENYALLAAHVDSATVRERTAAGRVLVFVDVLGRKNRCVYGDDGNVAEIHFASSEGDFTTRFIYTKLGQLTTIVLADHTAVVFRAGKMQPSGAKPTLAESYAAALEHWLKQKNLGR
jgi:hypothetical protein